MKKDAKKYSNKYRFVGKCRRCQSFPSTFPHQIFSHCVLVPRKFFLSPLVNTQLCLLKKLTLSMNEKQTVSYFVYSPKQFYCNGKIQQFNLAFSDEHKISEWKLEGLFLKNRPIQVSNYTPLLIGLFEVQTHSFILWKILYRMSFFAAKLNAENDAANPQKRDDTY